MNPEVVTVGLGYIGLPTSALIASCGTNVLGVDVNQKVVDIINQGKIHIVEPDLDRIVSKAVLKGNLKAATQPSAAEVYLIVVPTPFKGDHKPDISFVKSATEAIIPFLKKGDLYIIESTSPVGTTKKMQKLIFESRPELEGNIYIAYCPERVLPGNVMHELVHNDRVVGGIDEASTRKAILFYSKYVKGKLHATNSRTAEMCKLVENSSRDVQIAFANELSLICHKADINVWDLISLANRHPRVNILKPGCGVGGHCIAVDPYFITSDFPQESKMIAMARKVNNFKPEWCIEKIKNAQLEFELKNKIKPKTALLGLAFKPNIDDLRESPALYIAKEIYDSSQNCMIVEPNISEHNFFKLSSFKDAVEMADIIVFLVAHKEFENFKKQNHKVVLDFCDVKIKKNGIK